MVTGRPDWWRGQVPADRPPPWVGREEAVTGTVEKVDAPDIPLRDGLRPLHFFRAAVTDVQVWLNAVHLTVQWSSFEGCHFRQRVRPVLGTDGFAAQGSFGNDPALYRGCTFERVRFRTMGGFSLGQARFERCTFVNCRWEGHVADAADLLDNTFVGRMNGCVWVGRSRSDRYPGGRRNLIRGNDFTATELTDNVAWRRDFPLADQHWPEGFTPLVDDQPDLG